MRLTDLLRKDADKIWRKIISHPFVIEIYRGDLPLPKFKYYLIQDYNYLITVMKCFSLISSKSNYTLGKLALEIAYQDAVVEMQKYIELLNKLGIRIEEVIEAEPAPTNEAYMNFLLSTCSLRSAEESIVALLPCFWSYYEIALAHKDKLKENKNTIYREWGETYLQEDYIRLVEDLRNIVDSMEFHSYAELRKLFLKASRYEYLFWEMAYNMETWPI